MVSKQKNERKETKQRPFAVLHHEPFALDGRLLRNPLAEMVNFKFVDAHSDSQRLLRDEM